MLWLAKTSQDAVTSIVAAIYVSGDQVFHKGLIRKYKIDKLKHM